MIEYEYVREFIAPPKIDESSDMILVRQHSWGVTDAFRESPILKTKGLVFCIGVSVYDPESKTAGLLHMYGHSAHKYSETWMGPYADIWMMVKAMQRNGTDVSEENSLEAHVVWNPNFSAELVQTTKGVLINRFNIQKVVVFPGDTVAIDSRDGQLYRLNNYDFYDKHTKRSRRIVNLSYRTPALKTDDSRSLGITKFPYF